jgi:hypothetical protein
LARQREEISIVISHFNRKEKRIGQLKRLNTWLFLMSDDSVTGDTLDTDDAIDATERLARVLIIRIQSKRFQR